MDTSIFTNLVWSADIKTIYKFHSNLAKTDLLVYRDLGNFLYYMHTYTTIINFLPTTLPALSCQK